MTDDELRQKIAEADATNAVYHPQTQYAANIIKAIATDLLELRKASNAVLVEMEEKYDGAPDSTTLWMGQHIDRLTAALAAQKGSARC